MSDWPDGYGRRILETVDSTLNEAGRIAPGLSAPEWILARQQTAARGRRGRAWHMPAGNLACTLVMRLLASWGPLNALLAIHMSLPGERKAVI